MNKIIERTLVLVLSLLVTFIFWVSKINIISNLDSIISNFTTFTSVFAGFISAGLIMIMTSSEKEIIKNLKKENRLLELYIYIFLPIVFAFISFAFSMLLLGKIDLNSFNLYNNIYFYLFIFTGAFFIFSSIQAIFFILKIGLRFSDSEETNHKRPINFDNAFKNNNSDNKMK